MPVTMRFSTLPVRPDRTLNTNFTHPVDAVTAVMEALAGMEPGVAYVSMEHTSNAEATVASRATLRTATVSCADHKVTVTLTNPDGSRYETRYPDVHVSSSSSLSRIAVRMAAFLRSGSVVPVSTTRKDLS